MATGGNSSAVSGSVKWQIALAIGVPVAVGLGYWYYKSAKLPDNKENLLSNVQTENNEKDQTLRSVVTEEKDKKKTPLQQALAYKEKGNQLFKKAKYEEAIKCYEDAISACPDSDKVNLATFYQNKAAAHEHLNEFEAVKKDCTMALVLNPQYTKALIRRAKAFESLKDLSKALEDITAACILENFAHAATLGSADRILKELGRQHAREAIARRKPVMPSVYFIKTYFGTFANDPLDSFFTQDYSQNDLTGFLKAVEAFKKGDYDAIIPACTEEINLTTEASYRNEALLFRGTLFILTGQYAAALNDLETVIESQNNVRLRVNALIKRASIYMQQEDTEACMVDFNRAVELDPNNSDIYHQRGQVNLLMDKLDAAQKDFSLAVSLSPNNPVTVVQKCYTEYRNALNSKDTSKLQNVLQQFEENLRLYAQCPECFSLYAQVLSDQGDYDRAEDLYKKAAQLDPQNASLLVHRAMLALQSAGNVELAIKLINEAIELDDKCEFAYETLGTIEVQRGQLKKAIELFDKAIPLAKTELEMSHLFSLKDASVAQLAVFDKMNIKIPNMHA